jgi:hypothetical protein
MDQGAKLVAFQRIGGDDGNINVASLRAFPVLAAVDPCPGTQRNPPAHSMKPACERIGIMNRACAPGQQQERHLKGVFGQMSVGKHLATDSQHHRPMPFDHRGKRRFGSLATASEKLEQVAIRHRSQRPGVKEHADLLAQRDRGLSI